MLLLLIRTLLLYLLVMIAMRIMGKRQIGQLQPSELVIAIMISEVASIPMQNTGTPLISGIVPILTLIIAEVVISFFSLKSRRMRRMLTGYPSLLIKNGKIDEKELERLRFNVDDLLEELRISGYNDITDVAYAILETGGSVSIIPTAQARPATVRDLSLNPPEQSITYTVISDGHIDMQELSMANRDINWIHKQLNANNVKSPKNVFLGTIDANGNLFVQLRERRKV